MNAREKLKFINGIGIWFLLIYSLVGCSTYKYSLDPESFSIVSCGRYGIYSISIYNSEREKIASITAKKDDNMLREVSLRNIPQEYNIFSESDSIFFDPGVKFFVSVVPSGDRSPVPIEIKLDSVGNVTYLRSNRKCCF